MGRNKIKIEKISDNRSRQITYYKRRRGLIKKAMEMFLLCEVNVLLSISDHSGRTYIYTSAGNLNDYIEKFILNEDKQKELITTERYKEYQEIGVNKYEKFISKKRINNEDGVKEEGYDEPKPYSKFKVINNAVRNISNIGSKNSVQISKASNALEIGGLEGLGINAKETHSSQNQSKIKNYLNSNISNSSSNNNFNNIKQEVDS